MDKRIQHKLLLLAKTTNIIDIIHYYIPKSIDNVYLNVSIVVNDNLVNDIKAKIVNMISWKII